MNRLTAGRADFRRACDSSLRSAGCISRRFFGSHRTAVSRRLQLFGFQSIRELSALYRQPISVHGRGLQRVGASGFGARPPYTGASRYRRPYLSPYGTRIPYVLPVGVGPYFMGYPDAFGYDDSSTAPDYAPEGYDAQPVDQGQPPPPWPYGATSGSTHPSPAPGSEQAVTLFFKDGRPPEQVHNYILTRTMLYVGDGHHREIPTDELDLAATAELNQDAGVDFRLPAATR